jgi:hypothetical protein
MRLYRKLSCKKQKKLYESLQKYNLDNFEIEILMDNIPEFFLNDMEIEYIKYYDSFFGENGLNGTLGGDGRRYIL